jgi:hypothetical protein
MTTYTIGIDNGFYIFIIVTTPVIGVLSEISSYVLLSQAVNTTADEMMYINFFIL